MNLNLAVVISLKTKHLIVIYRINTAAQTNVDYLLIRFNLITSWNQLNKQINFMSFLKITNITANKSFKKYKELTL